MLSGNPFPSGILVPITHLTAKPALQVRNQLLRIYLHGCRFDSAPGGDELHTG